jgi:hypothetical protein
MWETIVKEVLVSGPVEFTKLEPMPNVTELYESNFNRRKDDDNQRIPENPENPRLFVPCTL